MKGGQGLPNLDGLVKTRVQLQNALQLLDGLRTLERLLVGHSKAILDVRIVRQLLSSLQRLEPSERHVNIRLLTRSPAPIAGPKSARQLVSSSAGAPCTKGLSVIIDIVNRL